LTAAIDVAQQHTLHPQSSIHILLPPKATMSNGSRAAPCQPKNKSSFICFCKQVAKANDLLQTIPDNEVSEYDSSRSVYWNNSNTMKYVHAHLAQDPVTSHACSRSEAHGQSPAESKFLPLEHLGHNQTQDRLNGSLSAHKP
jgi:hypothetical protein